MPVSTETIAALGTPVGTSAVALVRASGPACEFIATSLLGRPPVARRAYHTDYRNSEGILLDDVVLTYLAEPRSYTGEAMVEISCHGNPYIAQKILEDLFARGCRPAEPGDFTRRAFVNGRIDLTQAEAVMDLIQARSERALTAANQQLRGSLGRHLAVSVEALLSTMARVEAYIDFPDEDLPPEDREIVRASLERIREDTGRLLATEHYGALLRDGLKTVILGEPNAGKSSLLNRLVGRERALVSPEPGTTRDFIEERLLVGPHCIRLIDTAGLNPAPARLESQGMAKTIERVAEADLVLLVLDGTRPPPSFPPEVARYLDEGSPLIVVLNKSDLPASTEAATTFASKNPLSISALNGQGIAALLKAIIARADAFRTDQGPEIIAINARHAHALQRARENLDEALLNLNGRQPVELLASDLRATLDALGEIGGRIDHERVLDHLFASFCIGK